MFVVHDYGHIFNLVMKKALDQFLTKIISVIEKICSKFSHSPHNKVILRGIQKQLNFPKTLEVLRYVKVRWSSLKTCVDRILDLAEPIRIFYTERMKSPDILNIEQELYLKLLSCLLGKLNYYNKFFQEDGLSIEVILKIIKESMTIIAELIFNLKEIPVSVEEREKRFKEIIEMPCDEKELKKYLLDSISFKKKFFKEHPQFKTLLEQEPSLANKLLDTAFKFLKTAFQKIQKALPFKDQELFDADAVFLKDFVPEKWERLKFRFKNIIKPDQYDLFEEEMKRVRFNFLDLQAEAKNSNILEVWRRHQSKYPIIVNLVRSMMVIPSSSCNIERVFSVCADIKTLKRNNLTVGALEACLLVKQKYRTKSLFFESNMISDFKSHHKKSSEA